MMQAKNSIHGQWSSRWTFILAATGSAVGLGNIWRFPYLVGENGGAVFVLLYLACVLLVGLPVIMAEIMLGRRGKKTPINTMAALVTEAKTNRFWICIGWLGVSAGFLILSYYSVIAGWTLAYMVKTAIGSFSAITSESAINSFNAMLANPIELILWHSLFMMTTIIVVARGVKYGVEQTVKFLMPTLFILLLIMIGYAISTEKFAAAVHYLFVLDMDVFKNKSLFSDIFLNALGQAFFSLSIGMGAIMIYGSYLDKKTSILGTSCGIVAADTLVAILAGLAIFPIVFTYNMQPSEGQGLIFIALPVAFSKMPYGLLFGTAFFFLLMIAALTSAISLLEPVVTWLVENFSVKRKNSALLTGSAVWIVGLLTVLSFNHWAFEFSYAGQQKTNGIFDLIDVLTSSVILPLGGMLIVVFASWIMSSKDVMEEFNMRPCSYRLWRFTARYIAPLGVILVLLKGLGLF